MSYVFELPEVGEGVTEAELVNGVLQSVRLSSQIKLCVKS